MLLSELNTGESAVIVKVKGYRAFRKRLNEMGFVKGKVVTSIKNAPLNDPIEYSLMGYEISLRKAEAACIEVGTEGSATPEDTNEGVLSTDSNFQRNFKEKRKNINIVFVGNPNAGKTTLFNSVSGSSEHVGNYSGVTVDAKSAGFKHAGYQFKAVDLPGTYSLSPYSNEEKYVQEYLVRETPDVVINVIDASNLERNLYLTTQLIDMDIKVVIALNMFDELERSGSIFEYEKLSEMIGIPIVPTVGAKDKGIRELLDKVIDVYEGNDSNVRYIDINYGTEIEKTIAYIKNLFLTEKALNFSVSPRFLALKLLEGDKSILKLIYPGFKDTVYEEYLKDAVPSIENVYGDKIESVITDIKYGFITGALKETYHKSQENRVRKTIYIDSVLTHKHFGLPIFLLFLFVTFYATFSWGEYPKAWIESGVEALSRFVNVTMETGPLKDLLMEGIIGGVGGVIVFLPNILILFFFISFMEDTGYMARAAFIMDKLMHKIGLHGKSFIPMIMGFGCNVPAIMATRMLENRNDRLLTILINPFMSCSARLPVYILFAGVFFPHHAALILFGIYLLGIIMAVLTAKLFKRLFFKKQEAPFVMELPPYRMPTMRTTLKHMWNKGEQYLKKMGGVILLASVIIWALGYFPVKRIESADGNITVEHQMSYIERIGKSIEPIMQPLGLDWKAGVCVLTGLPAKEVVVSTMSVLYYEEHQGVGATDNLGRELKNSGFTPLTALVFMIFILLYSPCLATLAAISKEAGLKWAFFVIGYTTTLAWVVAFLVKQIGDLFL